MNIVYLVHDFPENGLAAGGAGNYVFNLARAMVSHGHNVKIIVESEWTGIREEKGLEIHRIKVSKGSRNAGKPMKPYQKALKNIWRSFWYNKEVRKLNTTEKIDIVQSVDAYAIPLLRHKKIPYVVRFSGYSPFWAGAMKPNFDRESWLKKKAIDLRLWRSAYRKADALVAPSELVKGLIESESGKNVYVVESPVYIGELEEVKSSDYNIISNKYWVTFCRLTYRKSIPVLAEIIDDLLDRYPEMKYVMIGRDENILYKGTLMKVSDMFKINIKNHYDRFIYMGKVSDRNLLFQIVKDSYACILPTRVDNLPNSILEAMALGKIVISTTCSYGTSVEQLIVDGYNGFLAEVDDKESLYQKIVYVMELSDAVKKNIEDKAKERVKDLTLEKVYRKMNEIYEETIMIFGEKRGEKQHGNYNMGNKNSRKKSERSMYEYRAKNKSVY